MAINPNEPTALNNLGTASRALGRFGDALDAYNKALSIKPDHAKAIYNKGLTLSDLGRFEEAIEALEKFLSIEPGHAECLLNLATIMHFHTPQTDYDSPYLAAHRQLRNVSLSLSNEGKISGEAVRNIVRACESALASCEFPSMPSLTQAWRGGVSRLDCDRHLHVFNTANVIAETCFGCYKIQVEPGNILDLIKLWILFDNFSPFDDCTRKCMVETRPRILGRYKGIIYFEDRSAAERAVPEIQALVRTRISEDIPVRIKRGCSELALEYPEFNQFDADGQSVMAFPDAWRSIEEAAATRHSGRSAPENFKSHNREGLSLRDALVIQKWLAYAKRIGDPHYAEVSNPD